MTHYAILGGGRLARHMGYYLSQLKQPFSGWARNPDSSLNTHTNPDKRQRLLEVIQPATRVLLLVSDDAIVPLVKQYPFLQGKQLIHCAGALNLPGIAGAHPLMTFAEYLYTLGNYSEIPFMVEEGYSFEELFPGLPNPWYPIQAGQKGLYHALCVMAGNFPQILWQAVSGQFSKELDIPQDALNAYLQRALKNYCQDPEHALTGPLSRGDTSTIDGNIRALQGSSLQSLYEAFVRQQCPGMDGFPLKEQAT
jgi:predicted short-subunit dehydrogenase-like oxidoreductase (DUF2520 family)